MTIDRVLTAAAPRIEKGGTSLAQLSSLEGEEGGNPTGKSAFSSVLDTMTDQAPDAPGAADMGALTVVDTAEALVVPAPAQEVALGAAAVLAQLTESLRPEATTLAQGPSTGEPIADAPGVLPGVLPGATINTVAGLRRQGAGATLPDPAEAAGGLAPDPGADASPAVSTPARRQSPVGMQSGLATAPSADGPTGRAGEGQKEAQEAAVTVRADWRATTAAVAERTAFMAAPWSDSAVGGFRAFPSSRSSDRAGGRAMFLPLDATAPGSVAPSSYAAPLASGAVPVMGADAPMAPGASSEVAHKVHYWVTRGVQTAELQLDALGGSAVDISISLQGKEALVEFRSDQPEARRILQEAMPQLRDMLRQEGLQLAGGFVNSSSQQKEGDARRDGQQRASERIGTASVSVADAVRTGRPGSASAHALDVFV
jgi:flagellar hook-length control protein FliK